MASPNESSSSKRRLGRRRLPPLEPGPALQFVTANHPDQFKAGKTMRHIRSHVMYKHRTGKRSSTNERSATSLRRSTSAQASSTPSLASINLDGSTSDADYLAPPPSRPRSGTWSADSSQYISYTPSPLTLRALIHGIMSSSQGGYARSAPPMFEHASAFPFYGFYGAYGDPLGDLKRQYIEVCSFHSGDIEWLQTICADRMSLLSHVSVSSAYQDLEDGFWQESDSTMQVKTHALSAIAGQLRSNDATILSILHLLLSEVGGDESAFRVHHQGLQGLIARRGGLSQLSSRLVTYITLIMTTFAILKRLPAPALPPTSHIIPPNTHEPFPFISPIYTPYRDFSHLRSVCPAHTINILSTIYSLTRTLLHSHSTRTPFYPTRSHFQTHGQLHTPPTQDPAPDWIHESIRLAAIIHSHAILHRTSLAAAGNMPYTPYYGPSPTIPGSTGDNRTFFSALLNAVEHTDTASSWGALRGVFVWVCIIGGAAAWGNATTAEPSTRRRSSEAHVESVRPSPQVGWARKCFSLWAVRAVVSGGFEHASGMVEMLRVGERVREVLDGWEG